jgi:hypothetical protein
MKRALIAGGAYFLALFALGFVLGTIRVMLVAPRLGELAATLAEVPVMLTAAFFICRWVIRRWQVPPSMPIRWIMALWFLVLLQLSEILLGTTLFGRTAVEQWAALVTPAGILGLSAQIIAALFAVFIRKGERPR